MLGANLDFLGANRVFCTAHNGRLGGCLRGDFEYLTLKWCILGALLNHFDRSRDLLQGAKYLLQLEQIFAVICSKPIFVASASEQILSSAERKICSNATVGQPWTLRKKWSQNTAISSYYILILINGVIFTVERNKGAILWTWKWLYCGAVSAPLFSFSEVVCKSYSCLMPEHPVVSMIPDIPQ